MGQESRFKVSGVPQLDKSENFRQSWTYVRGLLRNMEKSACSRTCEKYLFSIC